MKKDYRRHLRKALVRAMLPAVLCLFGALNAQAQNDTNDLITEMFRNMVYVKGGTFTMGGSDASSLPEHEVEVSSFYISKYEVTQDLWEYVMGSDANTSTTKGANLPVDNLCWDEAQKFVSKLAEITGYPLRLPYEAEWEFAARGGVKGANSNVGQTCSGREDYSQDVHDYAWIYTNSERTIHPVGQKKPNQLGLYDMTGNAAEFCYDWYAEYTSDKAVNPHGPSEGTYRVFRGGSYMHNKHQAYTTYRKGDYPDLKSYYVGLRLAMETDEYLVQRKLVVTAVDGTRSEFILNNTAKAKVYGEFLVVKAENMEVEFLLDQVKNVRYENVVDPTGIAPIFSDRLKKEGKDIINLNNLPKDTNLSVYSIDGKLILQQSAVEGKSLSLSLQALEAGVYVVKADNMTFKIVKR